MLVSVVLFVAKASRAEAPCMGVCNRLVTHVLCSVYGGMSSKWHSMVVWSLGTKAWLLASTKHGSISVSSSICLPA